MAGVGGQGSTPPHGGGGKGGGGGGGNPPPSGGAGVGPYYCAHPIDPAVGPQLPKLVSFEGPDGATQSINATEVTAWQYAVFRAQGPAFGRPDDVECANEPIDNEIAINPKCNADQPAYVHHCSAKAYCEAAGQRLCAPAVWERACSNGDKTKFGYGNEKSAVCNSPDFHPAGSLPECRGVEAPFDAIYDLSGNAAEWTDECVVTSGVGAGGNGADSPDTVDCRVRGGSFAGPADTMGCALSGLPGTASGFLARYERAGFRCCGVVTCTPGASRACYTGAPATRGVGRCADGRETCAADGSAFGPCVGEVLPKDEDCATDGDDDCDGEVNESGADCSCVPGSSRSCYGGNDARRDVGACHAGTQTCEPAGTGYGPCEGAVMPTAERCPEAADENCDGQVNEVGGTGCVCAAGQVEPCYDGLAGTAGVGICHAGTRLCLPGGNGWGTCADQIVPTSEIASSDLDEDCDGYVDEVGPEGSVPAAVGFTETFESSVGYAYALGRDRVNGGVLFVADGHAAVSRGGLPWLPFTLNQYSTTVASFAGDGTLAWLLPLPHHQVHGYLSLPQGYLLAANVGTTPYDQGTLHFRQLGPDRSTVWETSLDTSSGPFGVAMALQPDGGIVAAFALRGQVTVAGATFDGGNTQRTLLLTGLSSTGTPLWARTIVGLDPDTGGGPYQLAVAPNGEIWLSMIGRAPVDFGGGVIDVSEATHDVCVAKLSTVGEPLHARCLGGGADLGLGSLTVDAAGNALLAGTLNGKLDVGLGPVKGPDDLPAANRGYLVQLDPLGAPVLSRWLPAPSSLIPRASGYLLADAKAVSALSPTLTPLAAYLPKFGIFSPVGSLVPDDGDGFFFAGRYQEYTVTDIGTGPLPVYGERNFVLARVSLP